MSYGSTLYVESFINDKKVAICDSYCWDRIGENYH